MSSLWKQALNARHLCVDCVVCGERFTAKQNGHIICSAPCRRKRDRDLDKVAGALPPPSPRPGETHRAPTCHCGDCLACEFAFARANHRFRKLVAA